MYLRLVKVDKNGAESTSNPNFKCYETVGVDEFTLGADNGITDLPLAEQQAQETVLIKLFGNKETVTLGFRITDSSSVDRYAGTGSGYNGSVVSQMNFLRDNFITAVGNDEFGLYLLDGTTPGTPDHPPTGRVKFARIPFAGSFNNNIKNGGVYGNLSISLFPASDMAQCRLTLTIGKVEGT